jgi:hypothetical protein
MDSVLLLSPFQTPGFTDFFPSLSEQVMKENLFYYVLGTLVELP